MASQIIYPWSSRFTERGTSYVTHKLHFGVRSLVAVLFAIVAAGLWVCRLAHLGLGWTNELRGVCEVVEGRLEIIHLGLLIVVSAAEIYGLFELGRALEELARYGRGSSVALAIRLEVALLRATLLSIAWWLAVHHGCAGATLLSGEVMLVLLGVVSLADAIEFLNVSRRLLVGRV